MPQPRKPAIGDPYSSGVPSTIRMTTSYSRAANGVVRRIATRPVTVKPAAAVPAPAVSSDQIPDIYAWMQQNLPSKPLILELGAHRGEDTLRFFRLFSDAKIIAWEPDPRSIPEIRAAMVGRQFYVTGRAVPRSDQQQRQLKLLDFTLVESAVGAVDGVSDFYLSGGRPSRAPESERGKDWTHSSSCRKPTGHLRVSPDIPFVGQTTVPVMRLDTYFGEATDPIDFIWCDIQGAEHDMIAGATVTLQRTRWLFMEFDNRELYEGQVNLAALLALVPNFTVVGYHLNNVLLRNSGEPVPEKTDAP